MKKILLIVLAGVFCSYSFTLSRNIPSSSTRSTSAVMVIDSLTTGANQSPPAIMSKSFHRPVRDRELFNATSDAVFPDTVYITRDTLHILTKLIGECNPDNFKLIWNGVFLKSSPPQTIVRIMQLADPACKQQNAFHLIYNLSPLRYKQDSTHVKTVMVQVRDYKRPLSYSY